MIILVPFVLILYVNNTLTAPNRDNIFKSLISLGALILICEVGRALIYKSHQWFPGRFRLLYLFLLGVAWTSLILLLSVAVHRYAVDGVWDFSGMKDTSVIINEKKLVIGLVGYSILNGMVNFAIVLIIYEILYHKAQLRFTKSEKDRMEQEKVKAELLQLKGIVNPHFLFNNLNSLSSLIAENPAQAQEFLDELTKVFRYLLRNNETELTTLSEEIKFIRTYYHLLRTRYGSGINLDLQVNENHESMLLPPLTLQLLVENAVKHNKVHKDNPLLIEILGGTNNKLIVKNNICRKEGRVESTGIGLQNINGRYKLLNLPGVNISDDNKFFTAEVTLVAS